MAARIAGSIRAYPPGTTLEDRKQDAIVLILEWESRKPDPAHLFMKVKGVLMDRYARELRLLYPVEGERQPTAEINEGTASESGSFEAADTVSDVQQAIGLLDARQQRAIRLHLAGKTQKDIARAMGVGQPYVSQLLKAGRARLKELLAESYE